jgi:hypothetical protein
VWERTRPVGGESHWHRHHSDAHGWLAYDGASNTWLDPAHGQWRAHHEVGTAPSAGPGAFAERDEPSLDAPTGGGDIAVEDLPAPLREFVEQFREQDESHRAIPVSAIVDAIKDAAARLNIGQAASS